MLDCEGDVPVWVVLGRSCGLCWRSWAALGAYVGGLGALLGPMLAVLGRSWDLCWRSWAALGAYVGGLGSGSGPKLAVLGPKWSVLEAIRAKSSPNPSGNAIRHSDQGEKWPKAEREQGAAPGTQETTIKSRCSPSSSAGLPFAGGDHGGDLAPDRTDHRSHLEGRRRSASKTKLSA